MTGGDFLVGGDIEGFRAQLVVPEQQQLFDYWLACCDGALYPRRQSISPVRMPLLLPYVSLIDVEPAAVSASGWLAPPCAMCLTAKLPD
jgi:hypothetical protein